jgi:hypothetical protein
MTELGQFAVGLAFGFGLLGLFFGPIGKAIGTRIAGGKERSDRASGLTTGEMTAERIASLEDRIAELEADRTELRERLEFAERVLPRAEVEHRLPGVGGTP